MNKILLLVFMFVLATSILNAHTSYELRAAEDTLSKNGYFHSCYINETNEICGTWSEKNNVGFFVFSHERGMQKIEEVGGSGIQIFGFNKLGEVLGTGGGIGIFKWNPQQGFVALKDPVYCCRGQPVSLDDNGWALLLLPFGSENLMSSHLWNGTDIVHFDKSHRLWSQIEEKGFKIYNLLVTRFINDDLLAGCFTTGKTNRFTGKVVPTNQHEFLIANGVLYISPFQFMGSMRDITKSGRILWLIADDSQSFGDCGYENRRTRVTDDQLNLLAEVSGFWGRKITSTGLVLGTRWDEEGKEKPSVWCILSGKLIDIESSLTVPLASPFDDDYGWESFTVEDINDQGVFTGNGLIWTKYYPFYGIPICD